MKNPPNFLAYFGITCLLAGLLSACAPLGLGSINGSGNVITESRKVDDFDEIDFGFVGTVLISQGDETSLTIEGDDNIVELIKTSVRGNTLIIDTQRNSRIGNINPTKELKYTITTPNLEKIDLSGAGEIYSDPFVTNQLTIDVSGAGTVEFAQVTAGDVRIDVSGAGSAELTQVTADDVTIDLSGAGSIDLSGRTQKLAIDLNGMGDVEAGNLASNVADVVISGAGSAEIWVSESLDANVNGVGSINYYGEPSVSQDVSGIGSIKSLGKKE